MVSSASSPVHETAAHHDPVEPTVSGHQGAESADPTETLQNSFTQAQQLADAWLDWQCKMIAGVHSALIVAVTDNAQLRPLVSYPRSNENVSLRDTASLLSLAEKLQDSRRKSLMLQKQTTSSPDQGVYDNLALQLESSLGTYIVCLLVAPRTKSQLLAVQQLLLWGGMWLSSLNDLRISGNTPAEQSLSTELLQADSLYESCCALSNWLKLRYQCERVSVGFLKAKSVRLVSISQNTNFDRRQKLVRFIEAAMDESVEQQSTLGLPQDGDTTNILSAHRQLSNLNQSTAIFTVPLSSNGEVMGAVLMEREQGNPFTTSEQIGSANLLAEVGPLLDLQTRASEKSISRFYRKSKRTIRNLLNPQSVRQRWYAVAAIVVLLGVLFFPVTHHVSATALIEGADKQLLVSPLGGYIKSASYRAGDQVAANDLIATLDNQDLLIDRDKWRSELKKLSTSYSQALGARNRTELGLLQARKQQVAAELELVEKKLSRTEVRAPFDGVLVSGDLNQSLGAPVEQGEILFEIATLDDYRVILSVAEQDVAAVESGQTSQLRLSALPGKTYSGSVETLMPVAVTESGNNVFRVQAILDTGDAELKPGMRGIAKIATERDPFIWVMIHPLFERLSLWFWSLG